jgi:hypothetical protein
LEEIGPSSVSSFKSDVASSSLARFMCPIQSDDHEGKKFQPFLVDNRLSLFHTFAGQNRPMAGRCSRQRFDFESETEGQHRERKISKQKRYTFRLGTRLHCGLFNSSVQSVLLGWCSLQQGD